jgi:hypothetical protein
MAASADNLAVLSGMRSFLGGSATHPGQARARYGKSHVLVLKAEQTRKLSEFLTSVSGPLPDAASWSRRAWLTLLAMRVGSGSGGQAGSIA